jgi:hypothetical protein
MKAGDPEKPPDPAREAKLAARREKHAVKVWKANPKTQRLQSEKDAAVQELQILRDGTAGRQFAELRQRCERLEGEREAREKEKKEEWESAQFWRRSYGQVKEEKEKEYKYYTEDQDWWKEYYSGQEKALERAEAELKTLKEAASRRRGAPQEPEEEEEESEVIKVYKIFAKDRREITARLGKIEKTLQGVVAALGFVANANGGAAKSKSSVVTPTCGQKRKRDGRGGDRKSALYLLQCRMGLIPLAEALNPRRWGDAYSNTTW